MFLAVNGVALLLRLIASNRLTFLLVRELVLVTNAVATDLPKKELLLLLPAWRYPNIIIVVATSVIRMIRERLPTVLLIFALLRVLLFPYPLIGFY